MNVLEEGKISTVCFIPKKMIVSVAQNVYICLFFSVLNYLREKHQKPGLLIAFRQLPKSVLIPVCFFSAGLLKLNFNDTLVSSAHTVISSEHFQLGTRRNHAHLARLKLATLWFNGWNIGYSIRRAMSSILACGTKIFVLPGAHGFSPLQVKNVHCLTSVSLKLIRI